MAAPERPLLLMVYGSCMLQLGLCGLTNNTLDGPLPTSWAAMTQASDTAALHAWTE